jgi:hypothetical protein
MYLLSQASEVLTFLASRRLYMHGPPRFRVRLAYRAAAGVFWIACVCGVAQHANSAARVSSSLDTEKISVTQLENLLESVQRKSDWNIANRLSHLKLIERLSPAQRLQLESTLPGIHSRHALTALADESEFMDSPAEDAHEKAAPNPAEQKAILNLAAEYLNRSISNLPNFLATRSTDIYEERPPESDPVRETDVPGQPLHWVARTKTNVVNRNGGEREDSDHGKDELIDKSSLRMETSGEFGPMLASLLSDILHGSFEWSRWEQGASGPLAVFHYSIPAQWSGFRIVGSPPWSAFRKIPAYHGVIVFDEASGAIQRVTREAEMGPDDPVSRADVLVEYGSVEIDGKDYRCPVRSVAVTRVQIIPANHSVMLSTDNHLTDYRSTAGHGPMQIKLNDVRFTDYRKFGSKARLIF